MSGTNQRGGVIPAPAKGGLVADLTQAAAFYVEAFGAEIATAMSVDDQGRTMHVHFHRNGASLMDKRRVSRARPCAAAAAGLRPNADGGRPRRALRPGRRGRRDRRNATGRHVLARSLRPSARPLRRALDNEPAQALTDPPPQTLAQMAAMTDKIARDLVHNRLIPASPALMRAATERD